MREPGPTARLESALTVALSNWVMAWTWQGNPARLKRRTIFEERLQEPTVIRTMSARVEYDLHPRLLFADLLWSCDKSGFGDI
ncbi:hypothetical protein [Planktotalea sp.]|uniref:hypothetical protein n=1 Tax=Planktotalea sp. TaxID=2029877 RepID=UPI0025E40F71|nr:hypothetical protein [Planktotalea sp.]